ncbi:uncharacterized protein Dwil_GK15644 [Drosophila willistoni]|uniref:HSF-type DNA-binding domain-containing protein n=1 Tax=Drosophila willistoni TaxID=7260 RepID=B4MS24_DROWI|nr:uncharacterized protein LOC6640961 [Drosophila willistoni]EDW74913.1 uncharacterized protein Dwil_GK15644 [Drosophila willistoni]
MEFSATSSNEIKMEVQSEDTVLTSQNENPTTENARQLDTLELLSTLESANGEQQEAVTKTEMADVEMATNHMGVKVQVMQDEPVMFYINDAVLYNNVNQNTKFPSIQLNAPKLKAPPVHALKPFPFLYKLFLVAKSQYVRYINWSEDGLRVELHYLELQSHLASDENIFRCATLMQFTKQLLDHGFKRLAHLENAIPECPFGIILIYRHAHFVRDKPEKLQWIAEQIYVETENTKPDRPLGNPSDVHLRRMSKRGDLCSTLITPRSELQMARSRLMAIIHFSMDTKWLNECGNFSKILTQMIPRRGRASLKPKNSKRSVSRLPRGGRIKYVKPHESVTAMPISQITEYAGYFGNVDIGRLKEFFAEYLPRYGNSKQEIVMDATTKTSNFQQNYPIGINYSEDDTDGETLQSKGSSKQNTQAQSSQDCKVDPIDGTIEQFMAEICGDPGISNLSASPTKSTATKSTATKANTTTTTTSKPKVRKKRKLKEASSTEEEDDDDEEILKEASDCSSMDIDIDIEPNPDDNNQIKEVEEKKKKKNNSPMSDVTLEGENQESNPDDKPLTETGNDDSDEDEDFDDDDDYVDKNVEFRTSTTQKQSGTPRRYDLRNTKRPTKRYL